MTRAEHPYSMALQYVLILIEQGYKPLSEKWRKAGQSTRHSLKSCDELTVLLNKVMTSWPHLVSDDGLFVLAVGTEGNA